MKIVISTDNNMVSPHFGRCPYFTIIDIENGRLNNKEVIPNPGHQPGFLPQFFSERGIECIIAGGMGTRAKTLFEQYGIETVLGVTGDIDTVINKIIDGKLEAGESLCDRARDGHHECNHHKS